MQIEAMVGAISLETEEDRVVYIPLLTTLVPERHENSPGREHWVGLAGAERDPWETLSECQ